MSFACGPVVDSQQAGGGGQGPSTSSGTSTGASGGSGGEPSSGGGGAAAGAGGVGGALAGGAGGEAMGGSGGQSGLMVGDLVPDFSLIDQNPASPTGGDPVSPRDYLTRVSGWYFGHST